MPVQIVNDIEVPCSGTVRDQLSDSVVWTGTVQPGKTQSVSAGLPRVTLTIVRGTSTFTVSEITIIYDFILSAVFGPQSSSAVPTLRAGEPKSSGGFEAAVYRPVYKETDAASTIMSDDDLKVYIAAGGKPDDTIARIREMAKERARSNETK